LRNDPEHVLPAYTGCSIAKSQRNWADDPANTDQEKMLKSHWAVLGRHRNAGITLAGGSRAVSRPRSRATPEAAAPALRHDCR
jgi:hypothetical protein